MTWTYYARGAVAAAIFGLGSSLLFGRETGVLCAFCFAVGWWVKTSNNSH